MDDRIDIGHGVVIRFTEFVNGERSGLIREHPAGCAMQGWRRADGNQGPLGDIERCASAVLFDTPMVRERFPNKPLHRVVLADPLTLEPSLACRACGHHGFIRDGKWVPA